MKYSKICYAVMIGPGNLWWVPGTNVPVKLNDPTFKRANKSTHKYCATKRKAFRCASNGPVGTKVFRIYTNKSGSYQIAEWEKDK